MSYRYDMCFANAKTLGDAMVIANAFMSKMAAGDCIVKMLEKEKSYIPSLRKIRSNTKEALMAAKAEDEAWLYQCLSANFVFWPEYEIVGLVGESWPNRKEFFPDNVFFQNSCEQDYDLDSWPTNISFFNDVVKRHKDMLSMDLKDAKKCFYKKYCEDDSECIDAKYLLEHLAYTIRSDAYDEVYGRLELNDWLWGKENAAFERFTLSAIRSEEKKYEIISLLQGLSHENNPELWNPIKLRDGWIPCEKLMPESLPEVKFFDSNPKFTALIATYRYADGNIGAGPTKYTQIADGSFEWEVVSTGMAKEVIAWMPIPRPYN